MPYVLVLSVSTAGDETTVFGRQFTEIEASVKAAGIPFTLIRLPLFTDNNWCVGGWPVSLSLSRVWLPQRSGWREGGVMF